MAEHWGMWVSPAGVSESVKHYAGAQLTQRERDVMGCVARGMPNKAIERELSISTGTVKVHVSHAMAKLGASNRTVAALRFCGVSHD